MTRGELALLLGSLSFGCDGDGGRGSSIVDDFDDPPCVTESVGPDAAIYGFDRRAQELLEDACTQLSGSVGPADLDAQLTIEADYEQLRHNVPAPEAGANENCARLRAKAVATIRFTKGSDEFVETAERAEIDLRGPGAAILAIAVFTADEQSPLRQLAPTSAGEFLLPPEFVVWLTDLEADRVKSKWLWRGVVPCGTDRCGWVTPDMLVDEPAESVEVDWGSTRLRCQ